MFTRSVISPQWRSRLRSWQAQAEKSVSRALRWLAPRLGLEGKILTAMMLVLTSAIAAANWVWTSQSSSTVADIMGEQARQIAFTLSLAAKPEMLSQHFDSLRAIGHDLLKSRNILFVVFYDARGRCVAIDHRETPAVAIPPSLERADVESLAQVRAGDWPTVGQYLQVSDPVMDRPKIAPDASAPARLLGYVSVGLSPFQAQVQIRRNQLFAGFVGCTMILIGLPLTFLLVHRIFAPIRQLVWATEQIAAGDLETRVATARLDAIGDLARAFNEMVQTVKHQRLRLEASNDELEQKVAQRTSQLETANKRLSTEIAEKEDFLRAVSHDLNAPLRNIAGMAAMLLMKYRDKFDEDVIHRLERIQKNVEVETDLITELLELSRIKTRRQKMEMVEIGPLVRELEEMFESDLKNGRISLVFDNDFPILNCERARFRQIFQNLIDNAIKYMGDGPQREIHLGCTVRMTEAEFYVRDTGLGIDADDLSKIFFVFRRGKSSLSRNIAGKGVGLASVKSILETYNGTIWVESQPGQGSTFRFTVNGQYVASRPKGAPIFSKE
ncbi:MAG: HAMP domain-containing sensor histidine kinase [Tepidisphaeraceae bacterium]|jgi:signal transduction histidine kinase